MAVVNFVELDPVVIATHLVTGSPATIVLTVAGDAGPVTIPSGDDVRDEIDLGDPRPTEVTVQVLNDPPNSVVVTDDDSGTWTTISGGSGVKRQVAIPRDAGDDKELTLTITLGGVTRAQKVIIRHRIVAGN